MKRVLYVEDNEALVAIMEYRYPNLRVDWAESLEKANRKLSESVYDVILLDLNLSDSTGINTVSAMVNRGVPVIVVTGNPSKDIAKTAAKLGAAGYIYKRGMESVDLEAKIEFAIEKHQQTRRRYSSFSFGDIEPMKRFISCPPFANSKCGSREAAMAVA